MTWLSILNLILQLAAIIARQAERRDIEKAVTDALELSHRKRVDRAADARDAVDPYSLPDDDKYRRD